VLRLVSTQIGYVRFWDSRILISILIRNKCTDGGDSLGLSLPVSGYTSRLQSKASCAVQESVVKPAAVFRLHAHLAGHPGTGMGGDDRGET
jgi:hypothetical protein